MRKSLTSRRSTAKWSVVLLELPGCDFAALSAAIDSHDSGGWQVQHVSTADELEAAVVDSPVRSLAIVPQELGESAVTELVQRLQALPVETPVVIAAQQGNVEAAARAVAAGAVDFLVLGEHLHERVATLLGKQRKLLEAIDRHAQADAQLTELQREIQARFEIIGESPPMRKLLAQIARVARVPRPVLICGERGVGKELIARAIHFAAEAENRPIVTVNCAAFSDALLESELFGHEKGAFTGAEGLRRGKFEQASGGVLFLDEIGHMSPAFQQKILRVVEYGMYTRVGGSEELHTTARIIAATNRDLQELIRRGEFLPDLYDRLSFEVIEAPPLRERRGDVAILARYFLQQFARETPAFGGKRFSPAALAALETYSYPGNVRELKNIIERAAYRDVTDEITPSDLGVLVEEPELGGGKFQRKLDDYGRRLIDEALQQAGGNRAAAARLLGLKYHQFRYYLRKFALDNRS